LEPGKGSFLSLGRGTILACFHACGQVQQLKLRLIIWVRAGAIKSAASFRSLLSRSSTPGGLFLQVSKRFFT